MPTPTSHTLDELEIALDAATAQMRQLFDENAALRGELAEMSERMRLASYKLRAVAGGLPQTAVSDVAEVAREKSA
jgi:hypothetical protein